MWHENCQLFEGFLMLKIFLLKVTKIFYEYEIRDIMLQVSIDRRNEACSMI